MATESGWSSLVSMHIVLCISKSILSIRSTIIHTNNRPRSEHCIEESFSFSRFFIVLDCYSKWGMHCNALVYLLWRLIRVGSVSLFFEITRISCLVSGLSESFINQNFLKLFSIQPKIRRLEFQTKRFLIGEK